MPWQVRIKDYRTKPSNTVIPSGVNNEPGEEHVPDGIQVQDLGYGYNRFALNSLVSQCMAN